MKKIEAAQQGKVVINKRYHEILLIPCPEKWVYSILGIGLPSAFIKY